ncbi:hypothetical protein FHU38_002900 [Saccharomonospora amisosensis]|uniref:Uncharacterized protein n=1 Tax=Saccharomonospora amisosensis TaxID=1128677 RepID=A0A7X5UQZ5_9PSEU|nr:hypothetical protein [Saccharomonospora amisosensis]
MFDHHFAARADGERRDEPVPHTLRCSKADNRVDIARDDGAVSLCGGRPVTSGSDSSTPRAWNWRRCTAGSSPNRSPPTGEYVFVARRPN